MVSTHPCLKDLVHPSVCSTCSRNRTQTDLLLLKSILSRFGYVLREHPCSEILRTVSAILSTEPLLLRHVRLLSKLLA